MNMGKGRGQTKGDEIRRRFGILPSPFFFFFLFLLSHQKSVCALSETKTTTTTTTKRNRGARAAPAPASVPARHSRLRLFGTRRRTDKAPTADDRCGGGGGIGMTERAATDW